MYSDASGVIGFGAYCGNEWCYGQWDQTFLKQCKPSIEYQELYGVTVRVLLWIRNFPNRAVNLFCDNTSVKDMINNTGSSCKNCMVLLRLIVLEGLLHNVVVKAKYVATDKNGKADALSRLQMERFRSLGPDMNRAPVKIPECIWLVQKIWIY